MRETKNAKQTKETKDIPEDEYGDKYWKVDSKTQQKNIPEKIKDLIQNLDTKPKLLIGAALLVVLLGGGFYLHSRSSFDTSSYSNEVPTDSPSVSSSDSSSDSSDSSPEDTDPVVTDTQATPTPSPTDSTNQPDASHTSFSANPSSLPADGSPFTTLTITLANSSGTPHPGTKIK